METLEKIMFEVDEQYENEKGIFTVLSMDRDEMVIRWESGEQITTSVALQKRIAERRQWEKMKREAEAHAAEKSSKSGSAGKAGFTGFTFTDFKASAARTTWRSRNQLGEAVTKKISTARFNLKSWAFGHKPEMHVQDVKHHGHAQPDSRARFFVRVDSQALHYGFRVACPAGEDTGERETDWNACCDWLARPENEHMVHTIAVEDNLTARRISGSGSEPLVASENGWIAEKGESRSGAEPLSVYLNSVSQSGPVDLELAATIDKGDAVADGADIADTIARLFSRLLPLYKAAAVR
jgi:hypothetical protein